MSRLAESHDVPSLWAESSSDCTQHRPLTTNRRARSKRWWNSLRALDSSRGNRHPQPRLRPSTSDGQLLREDVILSSAEGEIPGKRRTRAGMSARLSPPAGARLPPRASSSADGAGMPKYTKKAPKSL